MPEDSNVASGYETMYDPESKEFGYGQGGDPYRGGIGAGPGYGGIQNGYETPAPWMQSTGSVRSSGTASVGNYFTRDEVLSMSPVEVRKNLDRIKASIPKWNV